MKPQKGYYSIVQYCPDLSRFEAANIGVLLFCPESGFLKTLTSSNNSRIIRFFGSEGHDWKRINAFKNSLQDRLGKERSSISTLDDMKQFIATRANMIQITSPRPMKVFDPEKDLAELFEQTIGKPNQREKRPDLRKLLAEQFSTAGIQEKIISDVKIEIPVFGKEVKIPFGYQNGRFNLIAPVRFRSTEPDQSISTACRYAVEGRSIFEHPDSERGDLQLVVVGQFHSKDKNSPSVVRKVFDDNNVKLFSANEIPMLIEEIRKTGKNINENS